MVVQSVMSATDTLGHWDVRGLSVTDPRPRQWICVLTMPIAQGCWHAIIIGVGNRPHMSVRGDNTTPSSNYGVA